MSSAASPFLDWQQEVVAPLADGGLLRLPANRSPFLDGEAFAPAVAVLQREDPQRDDVDAFLAGRRSLFKVSLMGTQVHVSISRSYDWTRQYTNRALSEAAVGAALGRLFMGGADAAKTRAALAKVLGEGSKYYTANAFAESGPEHVLLIDLASLRRLGDAINAPMPRYLEPGWREKLMLARLMQVAVQRARDTFEQLLPHLPPKDLQAAKFDAASLRSLLAKQSNRVVEEATSHKAAAWWRKDFKNRLPLVTGEREPELADLPQGTPAQWAGTVLQLAVAARENLRKDLARLIEEQRKHAINQHLMPHEITAPDVAKFVLDTYNPDRKVRMQRLNSEIHGGLTLTNIRKQPIYLLSADGGEVIFQNLADRKFYRQTLDGFSEEQLYSIYVAVGEKTKAIIPLMKWVLGLVGAVFPVVRYGLMAADVINAAHKLQGNKALLERHYDGFKLSYGNINTLLPGVLPKLWDAVLDKRNLVLFNPLQNPDVGAWLKAVIRIVMMTVSRGAKASYAADAVNGFLKKAWTALKKVLNALWEVVKHVIVLAHPIAGSTGVSGQRALDLAQQRLKELGVADALVIVATVRKLSRGDQDRLAREIQEFVRSGSQLLDVVEQSMSW